ncbi:hypothetical protein [Catenibacterium mitsuokai]|uniref:hypothetical protein n=1 Tax=Catenibacterium mitsuokai TaxID=100886 RepID=UPI00319E547F
MFANLTIKKLKSIDIINVLSDLVSEKLETTVKLPAFNKGQKYEEVVHKESMTLVGTLSINVFRGNKSINFIVEEIL